MSKSVEGNFLDNIIKDIGVNKIITDPQEIITQMESYEKEEWQGYFLRNRNVTKEELISFLIEHNIKLNPEIHTYIFNVIHTKLHPVQAATIVKYYHTFSEDINLGKHFTTQKMLIQNNLVGFEVVQSMIVNLEKNNALSIVAKDEIVNLFKHLQNNNPGLNQEDIFHKISISGAKQNKEAADFILLNILQDTIKVDDAVKIARKISKNIQDKLPKADKEWFALNQKALSMIFNTMNNDDSINNKYINNIYHDVRRKINTIWDDDEITLETKEALFNGTFKVFTDICIPGSLGASNILFFDYIFFAIGHYDAVKETLKLVNENGFFEKYLYEADHPSFSGVVLPDDIKFLLEEDHNGLEIFRDYALKLISKKFLSHSKSSSEETQKLERKVEEKLLSFQYSEGLTLASKTIVSDLPNNKNDALVRYPKAYNKVIYNNDGYSDIDYNSSGYIKGAPVELSRMSEKIPVGYNIYLPESGKVEAVLVEAYGGYQISYKDAKTYKPGAVADLENYYLAKNIAVINLNLVDFLKLSVSQLRMTDELQKQLHASINCFYEIIKNTPEDLNPLLAPLKGKKLFLSGGSFGGRTAVKQAELYPGTFDGYISHDGALSLEMLYKSSEYRPISSSHLDPVKDVAKIQDPIFIHQNFDDNNVKVQVALDFIKTVQAAKKDDLINAWFSYKGNKTPADLAMKHNKGHFMPDQKTIFDEMAQAMSNFMLNGVSKISALTAYRTHKTELYANKNYCAATLEEKFISEVYREYKTLAKEISTTKAKAALEKDWSKFANLYQAMNYVENWKDSDYVAEAAKLKLILTDQMLEKAIKYDFAAVAECIEENNGYKAIYDFDKIVNKQAFYTAYKRALGSDSNATKYLINNIYKANPDLVQEVMSPELADKIAHAHTEFFKKINDEGDIIKSIWQKAIKLTMELKAVMDAEVSKDLINATIHDSVCEEAVVLGQVEEAEIW